MAVRRQKHLRELKRKHQVAALVVGGVTGYQDDELERAVGLVVGAIRESSEQSARTITRLARKIGTKVVGKVWQYCTCSFCSYIQTLFLWYSIFHTRYVVEHIWQYLPIAVY